MGKINKDKFESYLSQNVPDDEPSIDLFKKLQKEAIWNKSSLVVKSSNTKTVIMVLLGLLFIGGYLFHYANIPKQVLPVETEMPAFEELPPDPINVIATIDDFKEIGIYKFAKYKSNDFNLSFKEDISQSLELKPSCKLSSI